jgi:hypothetical protein
MSTNGQVDSLSLTGRTLMNVKGYDPKERFEFGVITSFAYPIEDSGRYSILHWRNFTDIQTRRSLSLLLDQRHC